MRGVEVRWERAGGRHACRAPLWARPGSPRHLFLGRPVDAVPRRPAPRGTDSAAVAAGALGADLEVATLRQRHGVEMHRARRSAATPETTGDGLSTDEPGLALGVQGADCAPILIADRRRGAVAALHAGWRGTAAGIASHALEHLASEYGSEPADLEVVIGPAVGGCCYEVGEEVREAVTEGPLGRLAVFADSGRGRWRVDLARLNAAALASAGVGPRRIQILSACTRCANDRLYSYRAEGAGVGRNWSLIALPPRR